jgi:hypothetical protein
MGWVLIKEIVHSFGYTENAVRQKIKKGVWIEGRHWCRAPDNRIFVHAGRINEWIEGKSSV